MISGFQPTRLVGHEVVATIAQMHLHPSVLPTICNILNFTSNNPHEPECHLAPIATWADKLRFRMRWSASLHYVGAVADHPSQLCLFPGAKGWEKDVNVLSGIRNTSGLLEDWVQLEKSGAGGDHDTANEALKFLVHFLGDLHQPLHLTGRDRGGNSDKVLFGGRTTSMLIPSSFRQLMTVIQTFTLFGTLSSSPNRFVPSRRTTLAPFHLLTSNLIFEIPSTILISAA